MLRNFLFISLMMLTSVVYGRGELQNGVTLRTFDIQEQMNRLHSLIPGQTPNVDVLRDTIDFDSDADFGGFHEHFVSEISGFIVTEESRDYIFQLASDDGATLEIEGKLVIENDGIHALYPKNGTIALEKGEHPFLIRFFQNGGPKGLYLKWQDANKAFVSVPKTSLLTDRTSVPVVSPGKKNLFIPGGKLRPGKGMPLVAVHPAYDLEKVRPEAFHPKVGGMEFLSDGRLAVCTWERGVPKGALYILGNLNALDPELITVSQISDGLDEPLGLTVVEKDIYITQRNEITRFKDLGDGQYRKETLAKDWISDNYYHMTFGLLHKGGFLYAILSVGIDFSEPGLNGVNPPHRGSLMKVNLHTGGIEYTAGGFRNANGLGFGPDGELFATDNQGSWLPSNKLIHVQPGNFYGHYNNPKGSPSLFQEKKPTPPALYLPHGEIALSPSQPLMIPSGPYRGQMLIGDVTYGGLKRAVLEKVNGVYQGAVFQFSHGFEAGINRMVWGPEGSLYLGGIGDTGNWAWNGTLYGLERLKFNGEEVFDMKSVKAIRGGFEIEYTKPVDRERLEDPSEYLIQQWRYVPSVNYGGANTDTETLKILSLKASDDGTRVKVFLEGLKTDHVVLLRADFPSVDGEILWTAEAYYTLHHFVRLNYLGYQAELFEFD